jgi:hypothetical protein
MHEKESVMTIHKQHCEVEIDDNQQLAYVRFSPNKVAASVPILDDLCVVDMDDSDNVVGIEILSLTRFKTVFGTHFPNREIEAVNILPAVLGTRILASNT